MSDNTLNTQKPKHRRIGAGPRCVGAVMVAGVALGGLTAIAPDVDAQGLAITCDLILNTDAVQNVGPALSNHWEAIDTHWDDIVTAFNSSAMAFPIPVYISENAAAGGSRDVPYSSPWIPVSSASNVIGGGAAGPGRVICVIGSHPAIINGTAGSDTIYGSSGDETINGMAGDDQIFGQGGNDVLIGKAGNDLLDGGEGDDILFGHAGRNEHDVAGDDTLNGGEGNDLIRGDQGDDLISGGDGDDCLLGGFGDDEVYGWDGQDTIGGGAGADVLAGNSQNDIILGGKGSDVIQGNSGLDQIWGDSDLYDVGVEVSAVLDPTMTVAGTVQWAGRLFLTQMSVASPGQLHLEAIADAAAVPPTPDLYDWVGAPPSTRPLAVTSSYAVSQVLGFDAHFASMVTGYVAVTGTSAFTASNPVLGPIVVPEAKIDLVHSSSVAGIRQHIGVLEPYKIVSAAPVMTAGGLGPFALPTLVSTPNSMLVMPPGFAATLATVTLTGGTVTMAGIGEVMHITNINTTASISAPHFQQGHLEVAACNLDLPRMIDDAVPTTADGDFIQPIAGFSGQLFHGLAQVHMSSLMSSSRGDVEVPFLIQNYMTTTADGVVMTMVGPSGAFLNWPANWPTGAYDDTINGGDSDDILYGEAGNDEIYGDHGDDTVYGEGDIAAHVLADAAFNQGTTKFPIGLQAHYVGAAGNDDISGNLDDDLLDGGPGDDTLFGGPDDDMLIDDPNDPNGGIDVLDGGDHYDTCEPEGGFVQSCEVIL